ncbi:hypothetical protein Hs30E_06110 [Lactococcus hodotermopsidis]|uniref:DUF624 domain-containing protein n=1 Tax=Pseudolactococcus hodotermopsidis TaxID=2709157 RepID=A0A6A0B9E3_9LACT|nr:DUF624 domain-containing protein [Lactococcus hodotermopsidis]GFH42060.1 hypothetical protein Hs30E_06110 [Lactococcus hodotermopsidis]
MVENKQFTEGKLYVLSKNISDLFIWHICFCLAIAPVFLCLLFLEFSMRNVLIWAPISILLAPAFSAEISCMLYKNDNPKDLFKGQVVLFWQSYKKNFVDAIKLGAIFCTIIAIVIVDIAKFQTSETYGFLSWFFIILLALALIFAIYMGIINVKFKFRIRDMAVMSLSYMLLNIIALVKVISFTVLFIAVVFYLGNMWLFIVSTFYIYAVLHELLPMLDWVNANFIAKKEAA